MLIDLATPAEPDVSQLLEQRGYEEATGGSTRGWSSLSMAAKCWRLFYYRNVLGLEGMRPSKALSKGVLFHACMEAHFRSGGKDTLGPVEAVERDLPELCAIVRKAIRDRMNCWAKEEAETFDIRALEYEVLSYVAGVPTMGYFAGSSIYAPVSSKFDVVYGLRERNAPASPKGPLPQGVRVLDHKTTSRLSRDKVSGFGFDPQLLLMYHNWRAGGLDAVFGRLLGLVIDLIVDRVKTESALTRMHIIIEQEDVDLFLKFLIPLAVNVESMLALPDAQLFDRENWPMNYGSCHTSYGLCALWDCCETRGRALGLYTQRPGFVPRRGLLPHNARHLSPTPEAQR